MPRTTTKLLLTSIILVVVAFFVQAGFINNTQYEIINESSFRAEFDPSTSFNVSMFEQNLTVNFTHQIVRNDWNNRTALDSQWVMTGGNIVFTGRSVNISFNNAGDRFQLQGNQLQNSLDMCQVFRAEVKLEPTGGTLCFMGWKTSDTAGCGPCYGFQIQSNGGAGDDIYNCYGGTCPSASLDISSTVNQTIESRICRQGSGGYTELYWNRTLVKNTTEASSISASDFKVVCNAGGWPGMTINWIEIYNTTTGFLNTTNAGTPEHYTGNALAKFLPRVSNSSTDLNQYGYNISTANNTNRVQINLSINGGLSGAINNASEGVGFFPTPGKNLSIEILLGSDTNRSYRTLIRNLTLAFIAGAQAGTVTAKDAYDDTTINVFNTTYTNSTGTFSFNTTNGTIAAGITGNYTINFTRGDYLLYSTFVEINSSGSVTLQPFQSVVNINLSDIVTGLELTVSGNNVTTLNGQSSNRTLLVKAGGINVTARRSGYHTLTREFLGINATANVTLHFINMVQVAYNITLVDAFDTSIILNYNVTLFNGTVRLNYTTNNGFIFAGATNQSWNLTFSVAGTPNVTRTITAENSTIPLNISVSTAHIDAVVLEKGSRTQLTNFILFANQFPGTNSSNGSLNVKTGIINVTVSKAPYFNLTRQLNINLGGNNTVVFENLSYSTLNFSGRGSFGNQQILNFTINISRVFGNVTYLEVVNTTNGSLNINAINGTYTIFVSNNQVASVVFSNTNFTFKVNQSFHNVNFTLREIGVLGIEFRDERNNRLVDFENISVEMFSDLMSVNFSTANGSASTPVLLPAEYTLRYSSASYIQRFFILRLLTNSSQDVTLYMINTSIQTDTTITIRDELNNPVPNAKVYTMRFDPPTNTYKTVEILNTNTNGKVLSHLQLNTASQTGEFYKFLIIVGDSLKLETVPSYIFDSAFTLQINLNTPIAESFYKSKNITFSLSFNNDTNNFRYTFLDMNGEIDNGCLNVYQITGRSNTLLNSTCVNSTSGTILIPITPTNGTTYKATGTVQYEPLGNNLILASQVQSMGSVEGFGKLGAFMILLVMMVMFFVGIWNPIMALIFLGLPLVFASYAGLTALPLWLTMGMEAILLIMAYFISDKA